MEFCAHDVYAWDEATAKPIVQNPLDCVVGCDACAQICPVQAITFPDKEQLRAQLRALRAEMRDRLPSPTR